MAEMTSEVVRSIARLARLRLDEGEVTRLERDLGRILEAFSALAGVDVEGIEPTAQVMENQASGREDEPIAGLDRERALASAPDAGDEHFRVPPVIG